MGQWLYNLCFNRAQSRLAKIYADDRFKAIQSIAKEKFTITDKTLALDDASKESTDPAAAIDALCLTAFLALKAQRVYDYADESKRATAVKEKGLVSHTKEETLIIEAANKALPSESPPAFVDTLVNAYKEKWKDKSFVPPRRLSALSSVSLLA